jgi:hypothetical protein
MKGLPMPKDVEELSAASFGSAASASETGNA